MCGEGNNLSAFVALDESQCALGPPNRSAIRSSKGFHYCYYFSLSYSFVFLCLRQSSPLDAPPADFIDRLGICETVLKMENKKRREWELCVCLRRKESRASQRQPEEHINTLRCAQYGGANQIHMFLSTPSLLFYFPLYPPSSRERKNGAITVKNTSKNLWPNTPRAYGKYLRYF